MSTNNDNPPAPEGKRAWHSPACWWWNGLAIIAGLLTIAFVVSVVLGWDWVNLKTLAMEMGYEGTSGGIAPETRLFRDIVILCAAVIGILMAAGRNCSSDKQAEATNKQAKATNEQAKAANQQAHIASEQFKLTYERLYSDQFDGAVEAMGRESRDGKPLIDARVSGIYTMANLAIKQPIEFAERVVKHLMAYIKENAQKTATPKPKVRETLTKPRKLGGDVKAAFLVLSTILGNEKAKECVDEKFLEFSHQDFSYLDFSFLQASLRHYNDWTNANFQGANLSGATFNEYAILRKANFNEAIMRGITFHRGIDFWCAVMTEADLSHADMRQTKLSSVDLRGATLDEANLRGATLSSAKMHGVRMADAKLNKTDKDDPADLSFAHLHGANMVGADLQGVNLRKAILWGVDLNNAILRDAVLSGASFWGAYMVGAKIGENELTENVKSAMNRKIIHAGKGKLADGVDELSNDFPWRLAEYPDSYAIHGVLENFIFVGRDMPGGVALWEQAWKLRHDKKVSSEWREWMERVNPEEGGHPTDNIVF